jgi:hypothetical protein
MLNLKKISNKAGIFVLSMISFFSLSAQFVYADSFFSAFAKKTGLKTSNDPETALIQTAGTIINTLLGLMGILFTLLLIYGGYLWMTAQGDEGRVTKGKDVIKNAVIGLAIVAAAMSISTFVINAIIQ